MRLGGWVFVFLGACGGTTTVSTTSLPLGDGKYEAHPQVGSIFSCQRSFMGGGAMVDGPWIHKDTGTFDFTAKVVVQGSVPWPSHSLAITIEGDLTAEQRTKLMEIADKCPVHRTLTSEVRILTTQAD